MSDVSDDGSDDTRPRELSRSHFKRKCASCNHTESNQFMDICSGCGEVLVSKNKHRFLQRLSKITGRVPEELSQDEKKRKMNSMIKNSGTQVRRVQAAVSILTVIFFLYIFVKVSSLQGSSLFLCYSVISIYGIYSINILHNKDFVTKMCYIFTQRLTW